MASDGLFLSIKFLKKLLKNVLLNDEHIFEKYNFKITKRCISTSDSTLAERLQSVGETASLLYNRIVENMRHGEERLKDIVKKAAEEEEQPSDDDTWVDHSDVTAMSSKLPYKAAFPPNKAIKKKLWSARFFRFVYLFRHRHVI